MRRSLGASPFAESVSVPPSCHQGGIGQWFEARRPQRRGPGAFLTSIATDRGVRERRHLWGHPRGMAVIGATELWDRISFHGMQALLVLYMVDQLLLPGHVERVVGFEGFRSAIQAVTGPLSTQALASQIFGLYIGLIYFTPVIGGALGDRMLGRRRAVTLGALLMTAGHFSLAFDQSFLLALLLLILGAGLLRGNLMPQLGELYPLDDRRRVVAFQVYGCMISLGAFVAPLVTGLLSQKAGWHPAFAFAGFGMLAGLVVYLAGRRELPAERSRGPRAVAAPLLPHERGVVVRLLALVPVCSLFWVAQSQVWNTYNIWVRDHVELRVGGWTMPVPWLQSLDGLAPFIMLPLLLVLWGRQARRGNEPDELGKMALGCFIFGAATLLLAGGQVFFGADGRIPLLLPIAFHFVSNIGWLFFDPSANALFSRAAPASVNATMMGVNTLSIFLGSVISGRLGGLYEAWPASAFWALHAGLVALAGLILLGLAWNLRASIERARTASAPT